MSDPENDLYRRLVFLYGEEQSSAISTRLFKQLDTFKEAHPELASSGKRKFDQRDVILITYGDMVQEPGQPHLVTLQKFLDRYVRDSLNTVHILPFYPFSSDDGYAVIDYCRVNPELGSWEDIRALGHDFYLMFDGVFNHISASSEWFQGFIRQDGAYADYFITVHEGDDLSTVFRPRKTPLTRKIHTARGEKWVWTTYSADQIDLNYHNPEVLFEVVKTLLLYVEQGADIIRFDGAAYLWKEAGTSCINLPQTHALIRLFRSILDVVAPHVLIFTQTNVPDDENRAYFGNGRNEASLIYNFALPFMSLYTFHKGNATKFSSWVEGIDWPYGGGTVFFNFLAGHDGIGMLPIYHLLSEDEIMDVVDRIKSLGGNVSYKSNEDGSLTPYELNVNYLDAMENPDKPLESIELIAKRFLSAQAIMLALPGVPGIYFHSLFGSRGWHEGVKLTGQARSINRQKMDSNALERELADPGSLRNHILHGFLNLLNGRKASQAFNPAGRMKVLHLNPYIFAILRISPDYKTHVICLHNVSNRKLVAEVDLNTLSVKSSKRYLDLLSTQIYLPIKKQLKLEMEPYQFLWLQNDPS